MRPTTPRHYAIDATPAPALALQHRLPYYAIKNDPLIISQLLLRQITHCQRLLPASWLYSYASITHEAASCHCDAIIINSRHIEPLHYAIVLPAIIEPLHCI